jgi:hypothetical protein
MRQVAGDAPQPDGTTVELRVTQRHAVPAAGGVPGTRNVWAAGFADVGTSSGKLRGIIASCILNG